MQVPSLLLKEYLMYGELAREPLQRMVSIVDAAKAAMRAEGVRDEVVTRVVNRLVWGDPFGADAVVRVSREDIEQAKKTLCL
jgi:hypothetical protein